MYVTLKPGESLNVQFHETDGEFEVHFDTPQYPQALVVKETAGLPGSVKGGAEEILYHEAFGRGIPAGLAEESYEDGEMLLTEGYFIDRQGKEHHTSEVKCRVVPDEFSEGNVVETLGDFGKRGLDVFSLHAEPQTNRAPVATSRDEVLVTKFKRTPSVGFFMDASSVVHSTQLVHCEVHKSKSGELNVVETLSPQNEVTGEFTFYETMEELEAALGGSYPQLTI